MRGPARHDAAMVGADVEPTDVVAHDENDVGPLCGLCAQMRRRDEDRGGRGRKQTDPPHCCDSHVTHNLLWMVWSWVLRELVVCARFWFRAVERQTTARSMQ